MGILTRLREWIRGFRGEPEESHSEQEESTDEPRLDPNNVKEARSESADDAVERLQDLQGERDADASDGDDRRE